MNSIERFKLVIDKAEDKDLSPNTITRVCELMNYASWERN